MTLDGEGEDEITMDGEIDISWALLIFNFFLLTQVWLMQA